jgi:CBS domain containing-hemolysin-like protein
LKPKSGFVTHPELPEPLTPDSAALEVMTDFLRVPPVTVDPGVPIDDALERMKTAGVRLLLVVDEEYLVIGQITAKDIQGERPLELVRELGVPRSSIRVRDIMRPQSEIVALNMVSVRDAQIGHIVQTLLELERQHILVVEDERHGPHRIRGMFSTSQISKQLGYDVTRPEVPAHSLAEMVRERG